MMKGWAIVAGCAFSLVVEAGFVEDFAGEDAAFDAGARNGWTTMTGDGEVTMTLTRQDGIGRIDVDATQDHRNIWWAVIRRAVTPAIDVNELSRPDRELRVEAKVRSGTAPRRINLHFNHSRTTDFHSHLMEYDIAATTGWHVVSMTTRGFDARSGDDVHVQMALMDWGRERYRLDVDYIEVSVVDPAAAGADLGEPLPYRPEPGGPGDFALALPAAASNEVTVSATNTAILQWPLEALRHAEPGGWGMLELTTDRVVRRDTSRDDYNVVRVVEVYGSGLNPQPVVDVVPATEPGGKTRVPISPPVLRRLLAGRSTGLALLALGEIEARFYTGDDSAPTLYLNTAPTTREEPES